MARHDALNEMRTGLLIIQGAFLFLFSFLSSLLPFIGAIFLGLVLGIYFEYRKMFKGNKAIFISLPKTIVATTIGKLVFAWTIYPLFYQDRLFGLWEIVVIEFFLMFAAIRLLVLIKRRIDKNNVAS